MDVNGPRAAILRIASEHGARNVRVLRPAVIRCRF
jgi:hypothetical protein